MSHTPRQIKHTRRARRRALGTAHTLLSEPPDAPETALPAAAPTEANRREAPPAPRTARRSFSVASPPSASGPRGWLSTCRHGQERSLLWTTAPRTCCAQVENGVLCITYLKDVDEEET